MTRPLTTSRAIVLAMSFVVLCAQAACGDRGGETPAKAAPPPASDSATGRAGRDVTMTSAAVQHGGVQWAAVAAREMALATEVPAQLVPNEDHTFRLGAPAQARVVAVHVQAGDRVSKGQALVTLVSAEASTARADYDKAVADVSSRRAAATYARTARERADRLLAAKAIARQDVERAQADDELARSDLARAEAEATRTRAALSLLGVSSATGEMILRSPVSGVVMSRDAQPGAVAAAGAPLVTVSDPSTLWLDAAVNERAASALRNGSPVRFVVPAFPADTFNARVVSIGGALDSATRSVRVRGLVRNGTAKLRAQMFATGWVESGDRRNGVAVPQGAVMFLDERPVVFVAHPGSSASAPVRFEWRAIETAGASGGLIQVLSGVKAGELVVTEGAFAVKAEFSRSKTPGEG